MTYNAKTLNDKKKRKKEKHFCQQTCNYSVILIADHHHTNLHGAVRACVNWSVGQPTGRQS